MKAVLFVCLAGLALALALPALKQEEYEFVFSKWATQHGKTYATKAERALRLSIFKSNLDYIRKHQTKKATWTLQMNKFGDLSNEEFRAMYNGYRPIKRDHFRNLNVAHTSHRTANPTSVNWVAKGNVAAIKDQGQCGSCWAFSAVGAIESINSIKSGNAPVPLSEQQLVDCAGPEGNQGCSGGLMDYAFQYVLDNKGLCTESAYPYTAQDGTCQSSTCTSASTITGFQDVAVNSSSALLAAIVSQPISVAVDAAGADWQFYSGGIVSDSACGTELDHGVIAVGYDISDKQNPYYLVRNSWGSSWGESGYIRLAVQDGAGVCGIQMDPSYPTLNTSRKVSIRKQ